MPRRFILADRDGTLIVEKNYLHDPNEVELFPGTAAALAEARNQGWGIVCVSNQAGVGRGYFPEDDVLAVNAKVEELLNAEAASIEAYYFCPDHPDTPSTHRKPAPGMALDAARDFDIDLSASIVIGDKPCDIELGQAVGAKTVLVRTGYGRKHEAAGDCQPDFVIDSIADLSAILNQFPR
ncbi:MAG: HAD family hydrolase [Armatimonadetes bacterium]|nr:HAD family hydrolase [Armatimonadota bacterium]MBS1726620.1 HAD family hydrolase [Armatimonadota bacterium]